MHPVVLKKCLVNPPHIFVKGQSAHDKYPYGIANLPSISPCSISKCDRNKPIWIPIKQPPDVHLASGGCQIGIWLALRLPDGFVDHCSPTHLTLLQTPCLRQICVRFMHPDAYFASAGCPSANMIKIGKKSELCRIV